MAVATLPAGFIDPAWRVEPSTSSLQSAVNKEPAPRKPQRRKGDRRRVPRGRPRQLALWPTGPASEAPGSTEFVGGSALDAFLAYGDAEAGLNRILRQP